MHTIEMAFDTGAVAARTCVAGSHRLPFVRYLLRLLDRIGGPRDGADVPQLAPEFFKYPPV